MLSTQTPRIDSCEVCGDSDHCLPRWEDDGGGIVARGPLPRPSGALPTRDANPERSDEHDESPREG